MTVLGEVDWVGVSTFISALTAGIIGIIVAFRQSNTNKQVEAVHHEVKTMNDQTLAQLADADETRRIGMVDEADRSALERQHIEDVPPKE